MSCIIFVSKFGCATGSKKTRATSRSSINIKLLFSSFLAVLLFASISFAETKVDYGADLRLRYEYWKGVFDMGTLKLDDENYFRLKASLWGKLQVNKSIGAYLKISTEPKYYISSSSADYSSFEQDEVFAENLYIDIKNLDGIPVDLRIGRQDLKYGDGFLIRDGTPMAADRTKYFNAAKATWRITRNHSIDLLYIYNTRTDQLLPVLHPAKSGKFYEDNQRILNFSDEKAFVLYGKNKINENLLIEPYYIYKQEERYDAKNPELDLHTIGGRGEYSYHPWKLKGEYAYQFGEYNGGRERKASGGNIFISRSLEDMPWKPEIEAGYVYLSGDDPNSRAHEGWDPLFSRYKFMSSLYKYAYSRETGIGSYWTNLGLYRANMTFNFAPQTRLSLAYNYMRAIEKTKITGPNAAMFTNSGKERGHLEQAVLSHRFDKHLDTLLTFEYFVPGNFYKSKASDAFYLSLMMLVHL